MMSRKMLARRSVRNDSQNGMDHHHDDTDMDNRGGGSGGGFTSTLFIDFTHILTADVELAEAIQSDYHRFEPYLRRGIQQFLYELHPELQAYNNNNNNNNNNSSSSSYHQYYIALHNLPAVLPLRQLRTSMLCRLVSVTGTVTRSTEVRPELLVGAFRCNQCGLLAESVHQQYHYTRPLLCRNPRCHNTSVTNFILETNQSIFSDWQKLRVQENSDQIPPGCMPRSFDVMVRHEMVERAKAGKLFLLLCFAFFPLLFVNSEFFYSCSNYFYL